MYLCTSNLALSFQKGDGNNGLVPLAEADWSAQIGFPIPRSRARWRVTRWLPNRDPETTCRCTVIRCHTGSWTYRWVLVYFSSVVRLLLVLTRKLACFLHKQRIIMWLWLSINVCPVWSEFVHCGRKLKDEQTLDSYGIQSGSTLHILRKTWPEPEANAGERFLEARKLHTGMDSIQNLMSYAYGPSASTKFQIACVWKYFSTL